VRGKELGGRGTREIEAKSKKAKRIGEKRRREEGRGEWGLGE